MRRSRLASAHIACQNASMAMRVKIHLAARPGRTLCGFVATPARVLVSLAVWQASAGRPRCRRCERIDRRRPIARAEDSPP